MSDLLKRNLPKWAQMIVTGDSVTREQALEIIRRTDGFFIYSYCNDKAFGETVVKILKIPNDIDPDMDISVYLKKKREWNANWGYIDLEYISNDWIASSYIGGVHGWCHPDGEIGYAENIGKWPSVREVLCDWEKVASAFPFLNLEVTLMDNEYCEKNKPVVSYLIRNGKIELIDPETRDVHAEFSRKKPDTCDHTNNLMRMLNNDYSHCHGISMNDIIDWAKKYIK